MVRSADSVQSGGTSLFVDLSGIEGGAITQTKKPDAKGQRTLTDDVQAPVTYIPQAKNQNPVSTKRGLAHSIGTWFHQLTRPVAVVALGAALVTSGCAGLRTGTHGVHVPSTPGHVVMAPSAHDIAADDYRVQLTAARMNQAIMNSATPAMAIIHDNPYVVQTVAGSYEKHIIPEYTVKAGAKRKFVAILALPVSGHVGSTLAERRENARHYAEIDRHKVWVQFPDGTEKVLAQNLDPQGALTYLIKIEIELKPGRNVLYFNPFPEGRPELTCHDHSSPVYIGGFDVGRSVILNVE